MLKELSVQAHEGRYLTAKVENGRPRGLLTTDCR